MSEVKIDTCVAYRLVISNLRYGYTRNNHLMPWCAFEEAREVIDAMMEVDKSMAMHTVTQSCEECISALGNAFRDGVDDEFDNRKHYIDYIEWCLAKIDEDDPINLPYNINTYRKNLALDELKRYDIVWLDDDGKDGATEGPYSLNEAIDRLFEGVNEATYRKERIVDENGRVSYRYDILTPYQKQATIKRIEEKDTDVIR